MFWVWLLIAYIFMKRSVMAGVFLGTMTKKRMMMKVEKKRAFLD